MAQTNDYEITWYTLKEQKPRDGQRVLVYTSDDNTVWQAIWGDEEHCFYFGYDSIGSNATIGNVRCWTEMIPGPCIKYPKRFDCEYCRGGHEVEVKHDSTS